MYGTKPWYASSGVWGGVVATFAAGLGLFHYTVSPADQADIVSGLAAISGVIGSLAAVYGRIAATKVIA